MSWDSTWEQVFTAREWGRYPPEELIRFVATHYFSFSDRKRIKILEVGCGPGANVWFLAREGFDAHGIDGSNTAVTKAIRRLHEEGLNASLQVGDVVSLTDFYPTEHFDAVVDVGCLQHNTVAAVDAILDRVVAVLKPHGRVFSIMVAAGSYGDGLGRETEPRTFVDITEGPLRGKGRCHFFTIEEAQHLFHRFADVRIEYSVRTLNNQRHSYKYWVLEGVRRS